MALSPLCRVSAQSFPLSFSKTDTQSVLPNGVIQGEDGNLYGTTRAGGAYGGGTFFTVTMTDTPSITVLYSFPINSKQTPSAPMPVGPLVQDHADGNFYGITQHGGSNHDGVVFRITPTGHLTTIYEFAGGNADGSLPSGLVLGTDGSLYGVTMTGGQYGAGTVFRIADPTTSMPDESIIYSFTDEADGNRPTSLILGRDGNLYGTTSFGGSGVFARGTVFQVTPTGTLTTIHTFSGVDGGLPNGLAQGIDHDDNLYGTTQNGGYPNGNGTIFKVAADGTFSTLHIFPTVAGPGQSDTPPICASDGKLYGTTSGNSGFSNWGTIFEIDTAGKKCVAVYKFKGPDGARPDSALIQAKDHNFYGTTNWGGIHSGFQSGSGTVFQLGPPAATFVKTDTTTQGNWIGVYGADGWNVIGEKAGNNPTYPSYATVTPDAHYSDVWSSTLNAPACLQNALVGSTSRTAGGWYQSSWSMNVDVSGTHELALYLLDYYNTGCAETITIKDAAGTVLDTRAASNFAGGVYYVWNVSSNLTITLTSTAGQWALLSGIFFGP